MAVPKIYGVPYDGNGVPMVDRGTQPFFDRQTFGTAYRDIKFPIDFKEISWRVVSGTLVTKGNSPGSIAYFDAAAAVDDTGGKVSLPAALNGFSSGDIVQIVGTVNYDGAAYTLQSGTDATKIQITKTYVAETLPVTGYILGHRPIEWSATDGFTYPIVKAAFAAFCQGKASSGTCVVDFLYWR